MLEDVANLEVVGQEGGDEAEGGYEQDKRHQVAGVAPTLRQSGQVSHAPDNGRQHGVDGESQGQQDGD